MDGNLCVDLLYEYEHREKKNERKMLASRKLLSSFDVLGIQEVSPLVSSKFEKVETVHCKAGHCTLYNP